MNSTAKLAKAIPVMASLNGDETIAFYTEKLKFSLQRRYDDYLIFERDGIEIHFWGCADKYIAENTSCYVHVDNIEALYAEYQAAGVIHPNGALEKKFYGMHEFAMLDNSGNLIKFGEDLD